MVWHGTPKAQIDRVILTDDQWSMLEKLAEDSEYWKTVSDFMNGNNGRLLSSLSVKQVDWYYNIDAGLDVEVDKHEGKIAFGLEKEDE